jgi:putative glutamine amidotransferase
LIQDLTCVPVNHRAGRSVAVAHTVAVAPDSVVGGLVSGDEAPEQEGFLRLPVNSSHHQAIGVPGDGLRIAARSVEDGVIEAVELSSDLDDAGGPFCIGVQWHPERTFDESAASRALFGRFVAEAAAWTPRRVTTSVA